MFSTPALLDHVRRWVEIETPTERPDQINRLVDEVMDDHANLPVTLERVPGTGGCGDHLIVRSNWGQDAPGILVLSHLDTVHPWASSRAACLSGRGECGLWARHLRHEIRCLHRASRTAANGDERRGEARRHASLCVG